MKFIKFLTLTYISILILETNQLKSETAINQESRFVKKTDLKKVSHQFAIERLMETAKLFIGTPYKYNLLDQSKQEKVSIFFDKFDCVIYVETMLALYMKEFLGTSVYNNLKKLRYRNRTVDYLHRNHYLSDWIINNSDIVENVKIGIKTKFHIDFMSSHSKYYWQLKNNRKNIAEIRKRERYLSRQDFFYIPQNKIHKYEKYIKHGDIIVFTTGIKGLDFSHVGFAYQKEDGIHLLHASTMHKKVIVTDETISEYLFKIRRHNGIVLLRIKSFQNFID